MLFLLFTLHPSSLNLRRSRHSPSKSLPFSPCAFHLSPSPFHSPRRSFALCLSPMHTSHVTLLFIVIILTFTFTCYPSRAYHNFALLCRLLVLDMRIKRVHWTTRMLSLSCSCLAVFFQRGSTELATSPVLRAATMGENVMNPRAGRTSFRQTFANNCRTTPPRRLSNVFLRGDHQPLQVLQDSLTATSSLAALFYTSVGGAKWPEPPS